MYPSGLFTMSFHRRERKFADEHGLELGPSPQGFQPKGAHPGCLSEVARRVNLVGNAGEGGDCNPVFTQRDLGADA